MTKNNYGLKAPLKICLNITKRCNLNCRHCLSEAGKADEHELETWEYYRLFADASNLGVRAVTIGGGEPLVVKDLFKIIDWGRNTGLAMSLVTNGTLVTKNIASTLNNLGIENITVSLDGLEKNHDYIRGTGNFEKAVSALRILREECKQTKLSIRMTVNSRNLSECVQVIKLAEDLNLDFIRLTPILLLGRTKENKELLLSQDQYIQFLEDVNNYQATIKVLIPFNEWDEHASPDDFGCHCGKESCWITQTGDVYPCIFFGENFKAGNLRNYTLESLWERAKELTCLKGNEICKSCVAYGKCRGGCRARALTECNDINAVDPLCPLKKNNL